MDPLPTIEELLQETQSAMQTVFNSSVAWRDRYGHEVFVEALRQSLVLSLLRWSQSGGGSTSNAELVEAIAKLTEAVYRSG